MAQYDVYANPDGDGLLIIVQSDLLDTLNVRVVIPLLPRVDAPIPARRLNSVFRISGVEYVLVTQFLAAVPAKILETPITNLADRHSEILDAVDMLLTGF